MLKIKKSKGVMSKDGVTPWAAGTIHATSTAGWKSPYAYAPKSVVYLIDALIKGDLTEVEVITEGNQQLTISLDKRFTRWRNLK